MLHFNHTQRTLRILDHMLVKKEFSKLPKKCFKKEHHLSPRSQDPITNNKETERERGKEGGINIYQPVCLETEIVI